MAVLTATSFVIVNQITDAPAIDPRTGELLEFMSVPAARLAMRDLGLTAGNYRITDHG